VSEESSAPESLVEAALTSQIPSPEPETTPEPSAEPEVTPESPEVPEGDATEEEPSGEASSIIEWIRDELGEDLSGQFNDDRKLLESLLNARKLVGQRDEDAAYGKQLRQALAGKEAVLQEFLAGKQQPQETPPPVNEQPITYEQYQLLQAQIASGKATPAAREKWERIQEEFGRKAFEMAFQNPVQAQLEQRIKVLESQLEQRLSQREMQDAVNSWEKQNASALFINGDQASGLTPLGAKADEIYRTKLAAMPPGVERAQLALELAQASQPKPNPTRKPPQKAKHQPAIASPPEKTKSQEELIEKDGLGLLAAVLATSGKPE
jgi:hypothetical protein